MKYTIVLILTIYILSQDNSLKNLVENEPNRMLKYNKFESVFRGRGMTKTEMEEVFRTMDLNESG
jgi:hypothetical protein